MPDAIPPAALLAAGSAIRDELRSSREVEPDALARAALEAAAPLLAEAVAQKILAHMEHFADPAVERLPLAASLRARGLSAATSRPPPALLPGRSIPVRTSCGWLRRPLSAATGCGATSRKCPVASSHWRHRTIHICGGDLTSGPRDDCPEPAA